MGVLGLVIKWRLTQRQQIPIEQILVGHPVYP